MFRIFRKIKNRFLRIAVIIVCIVFLFVAIVIAFISPIAKYLIEKYSEKYVGRKVAMGWLYINPFTGFVNAHDLVIYEKQNPQPFIKAGNFSVNVTVRKLFSKTYEVSSVTFDRLWVNIIQDSTVFNFSDLMKHDTLKKVKDTIATHYCIRNININNSEFHYSERTIPVSYYITKVNIKCTSLEWNVDTTHIEYNFISGVGSGSIKGAVNLNLKENRYDLKTQVSRWDLAILQQYMKDFANYGNLSAFIDADIHSKGSMKNNLDMMTSGKFSLSDFHFGKSVKNDYVSFTKFSINIDSLSPANKKYFFSALVLDSPFIKYEKYDKLDNFSTMFGKKASNVKEANAQHHDVNIIFLIADYLKDLAENLINSQYRLDKFDIKNAYLLYNDYSLLEKFTVNANPIFITAKNIDTRNERMSLTLKMKLNPFGNVNVNFDVNPNDFGDFHLMYEVTDLPVTMFNPYSVTYASYPFHKGKVEVHGKWTVINKQINSDNHLIIINPTPAEKVKNQGTKHLPLPLIMAFVRDWNRKIDIDIPIKGDLKDPKYNFWDVILDVVANIFIKPPTFPYRSSVESAKEEKEDFILMEWKPMQVKLENDQKSQLKKISRYMFLHPDSKLDIEPKTFEDLEKEAILFYEAKKKYYLATAHIKPAGFTESDSVTVLRMSIKDSLFVRYLDKHANADGLEFAVQRKCEKLVGAGKIEKEYKDLLAARRKEVSEFFNGKDENRVHMGKDESVVPVNGFSHYKFSYKGEKPEAVKKVEGK